MSQGKTKDSAIAICFTSIMGKADTIINSSTNGGDEKMKITKIEDTIKKEKAEEKAIQEALSKKEEVKLETPEVKVEEVKKEETPVVETPVVEVKPEEVKKEEVKKEEVVETPVVVKVDTSSLEEALSKMGKRLSKISKRLSKVSESINTPIVKVEEVKKEEVIETPVVEVKEEVEKVETPVVATRTDEETQKLLSEISDLKDRLTKMENSPAPSKVIISKNYLLADNNDDPKATLEKVEKRLSELDEIRKANPVAFTESLQNEAFRLINQKDAILGN
jgi:hypothetical protein